MSRTLVSILTLVLISMAFVASAEARDRSLSASKCAAKKLDFAGRALSCRLNAHGRAEKKGKASASTKALQRCSTRLMRGWAQLARKCHADDAGPSPSDVDRLLQSVAETIGAAADSTDPKRLEDIALCVGEDVIHTEAGCEPASDSVRHSWAPPEPSSGAYPGTTKHARLCASKKLRVAGSAGRCFLRAEARALGLEGDADTSSCERKLDQRFGKLAETCGSAEEDPGPSSSQVANLMSSFHAEVSAAMLPGTSGAQIAPVVCSGENVAVVHGECKAVSATGTRNTVVMYNLIPDLQHDGSGNYSSLSYLGQLAASGSQAAKPIDLISSEVLWVESAANWPTDSDESGWELAIDYIVSCKNKGQGCDPDFAARNNHGDCIHPKDWTKESSTPCTKVGIPGETVSEIYSSAGQKFLPQVALNTCWQGLLEAVTTPGDSVALNDWWPSKGGKACAEAQGWTKASGEPISDYYKLYDKNSNQIPNGTLFTYAMAQAWAEAAGKALAAVVNADPNAVGISTDLEPTIKQPHRKVFHTTLAAALNNNSPSKFHTMWLGQETIDLSKADDLAMFQALGKNSSNYLTIAMYDRGSNPPEPITPAMYASIFATQLGSGTCVATDAQPADGTWPVTPGSTSADPAGVDQGTVCGSITESAWEPCLAGYGNPMLKCPEGKGLLGRFAAHGLTNPIQVGLPFKASTSEWIYRGGPDSSGWGNISSGEYPQCFRTDATYYKTVGTNSAGDPIIQNATADSMGDYVQPALEIINSVRASEVAAGGNTSIIGIYAYGISPSQILEQTSEPFLDSIKTYLVDKQQIDQICVPPCSGDDCGIKDSEWYSYGTAESLTNQIDEATWDALINWNPSQ